MAKLAVLNKEGKQTSEIDLPEAIFGGRVNSALLQQAVVMYEACLRQGNAATKTRGEVSGGGKKPWRQKGTGRARAGSSRSPLWKGGGVVFGPHPRDFAYKISKQMRVSALRESLNAKFQAKQLVCLEALKGKFEKTKQFAEILGALKVDGKVLAILDGCDQSVNLATRNLAKFEVVRCQDVNAYDVLKNKILLATKPAIEKLLERIS